MSIKKVLEALREAVEEKIEDKKKDMVVVKSFKVTKEEAKANKEGNDMLDEASKLADKANEIAHRAKVKADLFWAMFRDRLGLSEGNFEYNEATGEVELLEERK